LNPELFGNDRLATRRLAGGIARRALANAAGL
jgi:hypothetical protein